MTMPFFRRSRSLAVLLAASFLAALLLSACTDLFFKPGKVMVKRPEVQALSPRDVFFSSSDGTRLHGWFFTGRGRVRRGTVLVCHGNVENISTHVLLDLWLIRAGYDLFIFDYRGYGRLEGKTTVAGIHRDAEAALGALLAMPGKEQERVIVFGKSLGGAVATHLAAATPHRERIKGLIIEAAFADYRMKAREEIGKKGAGEIVQHLLSLLINNDYSPRKFIAKVSPLPVLILHGDRDGIVPVAHGRLLFAGAAEPRQYWELAGLGHVKSWTDEGTRKRLLHWMAALR